LAVTQHAPVGVGGGHTVSEHCTFAWNTPFRLVHCAAVVTTHPEFAPGGRQHAPCGTHVSFPQIVPFP